MRKGRSQSVKLELRRQMRHACGWMDGMLVRTTCKESNAVKPSTEIFDEDAMGGLDYRRFLHFHSTRWMDGLGGGKREISRRGDIGNHG